MKVREIIRLIEEGGSTQASPGVSYRRAQALTSAPVQRHARAGGHPRNSRRVCGAMSWIPASAGMTPACYSREQALGRSCSGHTQQYPEASRFAGDAMMRYAVVIEKAGENYSAYVPDLPGCVATGDTLEEVEAEIRAACGSISRDSRRTAWRFPSRPASPNTWRRDGLPAVAVLTRATTARAKARRHRAAVRAAVKGGVP